MIPGDVVADRYEILELLGAGGMGAVYRARHQLSQREVALKVLHPGAAQNPKAVARFKREASAAAKIDHEGVVEVLDAGIDQAHGHLFLAMELLTGETLDQRLERESVTTAEALGWIVELLEPLDALHRQGFVHRDMKPANVFLAKKRNGDEVVKLLDFGLTREMEESHLTGSGVALGTPHYMAPELSMSAKGATPASDVWALGVMLYEVLTGERPFVGETANAVVVRACSEPHRPLRELNSEVSPELANIVDACLEKKSDDRIANAGALRGALKHALTTASLPRYVIQSSRASTTGHEPTMPLSTVDSKSSSAKPAFDPALLNQETLAPSSRTVASEPPEESSEGTGPSQPPSRLPAVLITLAAAIAIGGFAAWALTATASDEPTLTPAVASPTAAQAGETPSDTATVVPPQNDEAVAPTNSTASAAATASVPVAPKGSTGKTTRKSEGATARPSPKPAQPKADPSPKPAPAPAPAPATKTKPDDDPGFANEWN